MTRKPAPSPARSVQSKRLWVVLAAGAAIAAVLLVATLIRGTDTAEQTAQPQADPDQRAGSELDMARRVDGDPLAMGDADAPVVLVEFADFRCPFCGVFARETQPELVAQYVETGMLRIEWRDLPVFGDQSVEAALAARAAGRQGRFWEFHEAVYAQAPSRGKPDLPLERLLDLADEAGVADLDQLEADMSDPDVHSELQHDIDEATALGASSTPVFLVNDRPIVGAQPLEVFVEAIEAERAEGEA